MIELGHEFKQLRKCFEFWGNIWLDVNMSKGHSRESVTFNWFYKQTKTSIETTNFCCFLSFLCLSAPNKYLVETIDKEKPTQKSTRLTNNDNACEKDLRQQSETMLHNLNNNSSHSMQFNSIVGAFFITITHWHLCATFVFKSKTRHDIPNQFKQNHVSSDRINVFPF